MGHRGSNSRANRRSSESRRNPRMHPAAARRQRVAARSACDGGARPALRNSCMRLTVPGLAIALALAFAACGPSEQQAQQAQAAAEKAQQSAQRAEEAAQRATLAAQQAEIAADHGRKVVDEATKEINRVADHLDEINREESDE